MAETDERFLEILNEELQEHEEYENGMIVRDLLARIIHQGDVTSTFCMEAVAEHRSRP